MRMLILTLATVVGVLLIPTAHAGIAPSAAMASSVGIDADLLEAQQAPVVNLEINKGGGGGRAWFQNPIWIAIGVIGVVLLVILVVMASKGGGTTVLKG